MTDSVDNSKRRLDEILLSQGLITPGQVMDALLRQKAMGGTFGTQLLKNGYVDEAGLVNALALQLDCQAVVLSDINLPELLVKMIPKKVAIARKVVPFDYDTIDNVLMIACDDPTSESLRAELAFVTRGKEIQLYVASELAISAALEKYYYSQDERPTKRAPLAASEVPAPHATSTPPTNQKPIALDLNSPSTVLLVTDHDQSGKLLQAILTHHGFENERIGSSANLADSLNEGPPQTILIDKRIGARYTELFEQARALSPRATVRNFENVTSLLLNLSCASQPDESLLSDLDLLTSLLAFQARLPDSHGTRVGRYTAKLCQELELSSEDQLIIGRAAYLHDIAKYSSQKDAAGDDERLRESTIRLLASTGHPAIVLDILQSMYVSLSDAKGHRPFIEVLGASIVTIVDMFCKSMPTDKSLTLDDFAFVKKKLRDKIGDLFPIELVETFIKLVQSEILDTAVELNHSQIMFFATSTGRRRPIELRLENEGFRVVCPETEAEFIGLVTRVQPDILLIASTDGPEEINSLLARLASAGVVFSLLPTVIATDTTSLPHLSEAVLLGIEDVLPSEDSLDLLVAKIHKLQSRLSSPSHSGTGATVQTQGTRGRLSDLGLIDLLQALGPSTKTVRITVEALDRSVPTIHLYLSVGDIYHASMGDLKGAEVVYKVLSLTDGSWSIESIESGSLPMCNVQESNDALLLEGCRRIDERDNNPKHSEQLA